MSDLNNIRIKRNIPIKIQVTDRVLIEKALDLIGDKKEPVLLSVSELLQMGFIDKEQFKQIKKIQKDTNKKCIALNSILPK